MRTQAHIYTLGEVRREHTDATKEALEAVGDIVGRFSIAKTKRISHPSLKTGSLNVETFDVGAFDPSIDLHLVLTPLTLRGPNPLLRVFNNDFLSMFNQNRGRKV